MSKQKKEKKEEPKEVVDEKVIDEKNNEKKTLLELIDEFGDVEDIFLYLTKNGLYQAYKEERTLYNNKEYIEPKMTVVEFKKILK